MENEEVSRVSYEPRCSYEGLTYADGTGLCASGKCMVCNDGEWEDDSLHNAYPPTS